jgi:hypothetical protein
MRIIHLVMLAFLFHSLPPLQDYGSRPYLITGGQGEKGSHPKKPLLVL